MPSTPTRKNIELPSAEWDSSPWFPTLITPYRRLVRNLAVSTLDQLSHQALGNLGGNGEIRTLGGLSTLDALAKRWFKPLTHVSKPWCNSLADREGFEPSEPFNGFATFPRWCVRPLHHLSIKLLRNYFEDAIGFEPMVDSHPLPLSRQAL